jgi:FkbM family methyltransferase
MNKILIQIGSAEGNDHVTDILKSNEDILGILVEPNPNNFKLLKENYKNFKNLFFENLAISTNEGELNLYVEPGEISHHGSFNYDHLIAHAHHPKDIKTLKVQTITLEQLLFKYSLVDKKVDFLFMDTEGHDCDILLSTDFLKFNIENICFESFHADGPRKQGVKLKQTINHLNKFGYEIDSSRNIAWSLWMTKK